MTCALCPCLYRQQAVGLGGGREGTGRRRTEHLFIPHLGQTDCLGRLSSLFALAGQTGWAGSRLPCYLHLPFRRSFCHAHTLFVSHGPATSLGKGDWWGRDLAEQAPWCPCLPCAAKHLYAIIPPKRDQCLTGVSDITSCYPCSSPTQRRLGWRQAGRHLELCLRGLCQLRMPGLVLHATTTNLVPGLLTFSFPNPTLSSLLCRTLFGHGHDFVLLSPTYCSCRHCRQEVVEYALHVNTMQASAQLPSSLLPCSSVPVYVFMGNSWLSHAFQLSVYPIYLAWLAICCYAVEWDFCAYVFTWAGRGWLPVETLALVGGDMLAWLPASCCLLHFLTLLQTCTRMKNFCPSYFSLSLLLLMSLLWPFCWATSQIFTHTPKQGRHTCCMRMPDLSTG